MNLVALEGLAPLGEIGWPLALALAWLAAEFCHRWFSLPRISTYGLVGFALGQGQLGLLPATGEGLGAVLANIAFGLILFEFGYRVNLRWLVRNPWLGASALLEAGVTFVAIYLLARAWGSAVLTSLLLASLAMASSPAAALRVINEQHANGQVTERLLHLTAVDCVLAAFVFKAVVGFWTFASSGNLALAASNSAVVLVASALLGGLFGLALPALLRVLPRTGEDATLAFALAVILVVAAAHALKASPLLAALTLGLVARHRRAALSQTQRNFGALGDLLAVALFVYVGATLDWSRVVAGIGLGLALVAVRAAAKLIAVGALAHASGVSWRKGALSGLALAPNAVFVILLLEQTRYLGVDLLDQLAPLAAATLVLELAGPLVTQWCLRAANETPSTTRPDPGGSA